jgi:hypothetical protein
MVSRMFRKSFAQWVRNKLFTITVHTNGITELLIHSRTRRKRFRECAMRAYLLSGLSSVSVLCQTNLSFSHDYARMYSEMFLQVLVWDY